MAIKLVTEVMDCAPPTLTHREHKVLIILAENARLSTRETWDSVESPLILHRAQLTRREMYAAIAALIDKGCLEKPVWGGRNHRAKYVIARLRVPRPVHDQCAEKPHTENHDQCAVFTDTEKPRSVCGKTTPRLPSSTGRVRAGLESAALDVEAQPRASVDEQSCAGITPLPDRVSPATPLQSRKRDHNGSEPDGPDDQQIPIEVQLQSSATDRNAREDGQP